MDEVFEYDALALHAQADLQALGERAEAEETSGRGGRRRRRQQERARECAGARVSQAGNMAPLRQVGRSAVSVDSRGGGGTGGGQNRRGGGGESSRGSSGESRWIGGEIGRCGGRGGSRAGESSREGESSCSDGIPVPSRRGRRRCKQGGEVPSPIGSNDNEWLSSSPFADNDSPEEGGTFYGAGASSTSYSYTPSPGEDDTPSPGEAFTPSPGNGYPPSTANGSFGPESSFSEQLVSAASPHADRSLLCCHQLALPHCHTSGPPHQRGIQMSWIGTGRGRGR